MDGATIRNECILIVDGDAAERERLREALDEHDLSVLEASDGDAALASVSDTLPSAVLLDTGIRFPEGLEFCTWLRARPRADWLAVLMMSTSGDGQLVAQCYAAGATDFIEKPINYAAIGYRVRTFLRTSEAFYRLEATVTELDSHRDRLKRLAYFDTLTGLPNRAAFMHHLEAAVHVCRRTTEPLALLFIDVDDFKRINDTLGHNVGDGVLATFARRLQDGIDQTPSLTPRVQRTTASLDGSGSLVARLAGDEFTVMLRGALDLSLVEGVAERLVARLNAPMFIDGHRLVLSSSIGLAMLPREGGDVFELLHRADQAMYTAKHAGKNGFRSFLPNAA